MAEAQVYPTKNGDILFRESFCGTFFKSSPLAVLEAEYEFNRKYALGEGDQSLALFYSLLDLEPPAQSKDIGWCYDYMGVEWETMWVDFIHRPRITKEGVPYTEIYYPIPPVSLYYEEDNPFM